MDFSDAMSLKALEDENRKLKGLVADLILDNKILKDLSRSKNRYRESLCRRRPGDPPEEKKETDSFPSHSAATCHHAEQNVVNGLCP
jgi:hypothetical protein